MTHFSPDPLSTGTQDHLLKLRQTIEQEAQGKPQYEKARGLWTNRKNGKTNKVIWSEIEQKLNDRYPRKGICQYCEFDRPAATEHIYPQKHFPSKAFDWNNYLLVCYRCNSTYKRDKFAVFFPNGSSTVVELLHTKSSYSIPPGEDAVLINPRADDPADYLMLDLLTGMFVLAPGIDERGTERAQYTCRLLHLNSDANLLRYRKKAIENYLQKLKRYVEVKQARDFRGLLEAMPFATVSQTKPFAEEQARLLDTIKQDLNDDLFPCAWRAIKKQQSIHAQISKWFALAPEAEEWQ